MHLHICIYIYVFTYIYIHISIYIYTFDYIYIYTFDYMYVVSPVTKDFGSFFAPPKLCAVGLLAFGAALGGDGSGLGAKSRAAHTLGMVYICLHGEIR